MRPRLDELVVKIIDYCDMACAMCGQLSQARRRRLLSLAALQRLLADIPLAALRVYVWGGEPLLHPEFDAIVRYLKQRQAIVAVNTNGSRLTDHAWKIIEIGVDRIIVSVDGIGHVHDRIRGQGAFAALTRGIELLNESRVHGAVPLLRVNFVILPENYLDIPSVLRWCREVGVYRVHLQLPMFVTHLQLDAYEALLNDRGIGAMRNYEAFARMYDGFDFEVLAELLGEVAAAHHDIARVTPYSGLSAHQLRSYFSSTEPLGQYRCNLLGDRLAIDTRGEFVACPDFPDVSFGSSVREINQSATYRWWSEALHNSATLPICQRCCHFSSVQEAATGLVVNGSRAAKDA